MYIYIYIYTHNIYTYIPIYMWGYIYIYIYIRIVFMESLYIYYALCFVHVEHSGCHERISVLINISMLLA